MCVCVRAKSLQSCAILCNLFDCKAHQAPLSMVFSRQECWSKLPCPPPGDRPNPGKEPMSFRSPALAGMFFTTSTIWEAHMYTLPTHCKCETYCSAVSAAKKWHHYIIKCYDDDHVNVPVPCCSEHSLCTSNVSITWNLVRNNLKPHPRCTK